MEAKGREQASKESRARVCLLCSKLARLARKCIWQVTCMCTIPDPVMVAYRKKKRNTGMCRPENATCCLPIQHVQCKTLSFFLKEIFCFKYLKVGFCQFECLSKVFFLQTCVGTATQTALKGKKNLQFDDEFHKPLLKPSKMKRLGFAVAGARRFCRFHAVPRLACRPVNQVKWVDLSKDTASPLSTGYIIQLEN